jgi:hypothetical protein
MAEGVFVMGIVEINTERLIYQINYGIYLTDFGNPASPCTNHSQHGCTHQMLYDSEQHK